MPWLELGITARALILPIETHGKLAKFDAPAGSTCWQSLELGTSVNFRELSETKGQLTQRPNVGVRTRAQHKLNSSQVRFQRQIPSFPPHVSGSCLSTSKRSTIQNAFPASRLRFKGEVAANIVHNIPRLLRSELLETLELRIRQGLESLLHLGVLGVSCTSPDKKSSGTQD